MKVLSTQFTEYDSLKYHQLQAFITLNAGVKRETNPTNFSLLGLLSIQICLIWENYGIKEMCVSDL